MLLSSKDFLINTSIGYVMRGQGYDSVLDVPDSSGLQKPLRNKLADMFNDMSALQSVPQFQGSTYP